MVILILKNYKKLKNTVYICTKHYKNLKKKKQENRNFVYFMDLNIKAGQCFMKIILINWILN